MFARGSWGAIGREVQLAYTLRAIFLPATIKQLESDSAWGIIVPMSDADNQPRSGQRPDPREESGIIVFGGGGGSGCAGRGCLFWILVSIVLSVALTVLVNLVLLLFSGGGSPGGVGV